MAAFRQRQQEDLAHRAVAINDDSAAGIRRRRKFHERYKNNKSSQTKAESEDEIVEHSEGSEVEEDEHHSGSEVNGHIDVDEGEEAWRNAEGERLDDFGVDEDVEFYDEEDVPLSVLKERIKAGL
jgi:palmitoyltransferase